MRHIICDENGHSGKEKGMFLTIDAKNLFYAGSILSPSAFKLYLHLCMNREGYSFLLDGTRFTKQWNVSRTQYNSAFHQLLEENFLTFDEEDNCYHFNGSGTKVKKGEEE